MTGQPDPPRNPLLGWLRALFTPQTAAPPPPRQPPPALPQAAPVPDQVAMSEGEARPPGDRFAAWLRGFAPRVVPVATEDKPAPLSDQAVLEQRFWGMDTRQMNPHGLGQRRAQMGEAWPVLLRVLEEADATAAGCNPTHLFAAIPPAVARLSLRKRAVLAEELADRVRTRPPLTGRPKVDDEVFEALLAHPPPLDPKSATALFTFFGRGANLKSMDRGYGLGGFGRLVRRMEEIGGFEGCEPLVEAWQAIRDRYPELHPNAVKEEELVARVEALLGIAAEEEPEPESEPAPPESPFVVFDGLGSAEDAARVRAFAEAMVALDTRGELRRPPRDWQLRVALAHAEGRGQPATLPPDAPPEDRGGWWRRNLAENDLLGRTPFLADTVFDPPAWMREADALYAAATARLGEVTICSEPTLHSGSRHLRVADFEPIPPDHPNPAEFIDLARGRRAAERLCGIRFRDWATGEVQELATLRAADPELEEMLRRARSAEPTRAWLQEAEALHAGPTGAICRDAVLHWLDLAADGSAGLPSPTEYRLAIRYLHIERVALGYLDTFGGPREAAMMALCTKVEAFADTGHGFVAALGRDSPALLSDANDVMLRGAVWFAGLDPAEVPRLLRVALAMLEKVPAPGGLNYRSLIGINACIGALGRIATSEAVVALGRIRRRIRDERLAKTIAKAMATAAARAGSTIEDLEELSVPDLGLEPGPNAACTIPLADGATATLSILGSAQTSVTLRRSDGRIAKSVPAAVAKDKDSTAALQELRAAAKEVAAILPVQRLRLERSWLTGRRWTGRDFRDRYLSHPLLGWLAARLIWTITPAGGPPFSAIFRDGTTPTDAEGRPGVLADDDLVALWHPLAPVEPGAVGAWRAALLREEIVQPIRQAFRETYPLTEAERETATYSNRFAAHILRQSQANALARLRGWVCRTRMSADVPNDEPTHMKMPALGLAAEFWTKPDGEGNDMTDGGAYLYLGTDRVIFRPLRDEGDWRHDGGRGLRVGVGAVPLDQVPAIPFSEVMRDVDLFVGVASIGRDEAWADAGAQAQHPSQWRQGVALQYWQGFSRAELQESGRVRRDVLAALLPKLAIAACCRLDERHLMVTGVLRCYRIHLGSGHVFLDPEDRYVCIVPAGRDPAAAIRLPFEGDAVLSLILSKAFLLAADNRIKDPGILSQIR